MITLEPPRGTQIHAEPRRAVVSSSDELSLGGLTRFLHAAQKAIGLAGEVNVLLADDRTLRRLNRQYLGKDKATDVLSFPVHAGFADHSAGDLALSLETAQRQAAEHKHSLKVEVRILLLHGLLHLQGMDHEIDEGQMAERERILRRQLRLPNGLIARAHATLPMRANRSRATA